MSVCDVATGPPSSLSRSQAATSPPFATSLELSATLYRHTPRQRQTVLWAGPCIYHTIEARPMSFSLDLFLPPLFASTWPLFRSHSPKAVSIRISESLCCTLDPTFWICAMHLHSQSTQSPLSYPCPLYDRLVKRCTCANAAGVRYF